MPQGALALSVFLFTILSREALNSHWCLMVTIWLPNLWVSCLCSRQEEGEKAKSQRAKGEKAFSPPDSISLFRKGIAPQGLLFYLIS